MNDLYMEVGILNSLIYTSIPTLGFLSSIRYRYKPMDIKKPFHMKLLHLNAARLDWYVTKVYYENLVHN